MDTNWDNFGLDAIQADVAAAKPPPEGMKVSGYEVKLSAKAGLYLVSVIVRGEGKRSKPVPIHTLLCPAAMVGEFVYAYHNLHVRPAKALQPSLAAVRELRLLQKNGEGTPNA